MLPDGWSQDTTRALCVSQTSNRCLQWSGSPGSELGEAKPNTFRSQASAGKAFAQHVIPIHRQTCLIPLILTTPRLDNEKAKERSGFWNGLCVECSKVPSVGRVQQLMSTQKKKKKLANGCFAAKLAYFSGQEHVLLCFQND